MHNIPIQNDSSNVLVSNLILFCLRNINNLNIEITESEKRIIKLSQEEKYMKKAIGFGSRSLLFFILNELEQNRIVFYENRLIELKKHKDSVITKNKYLVNKRDKYVDDYFECIGQTGKDEMAPMLLRKVNKKRK